MREREKKKRNNGPFDPLARARRGRGKPFSLFPARTSSCSNERQSLELLFPVHRVQQRASERVARLIEGEMECIACDARGARMSVVN